MHQVSVTSGYTSRKFCCLLSFYCQFFQRESCLESHQLNLSTVQELVAMASTDRMPLSYSLLFTIIIGLSHTLFGDAIATHDKIRDIGSSGSRCNIQIALKTAECQDLGLNFIPRDLPGDIDTLNLKINNITSLWRSSFESYPFIKNLILNQNDIRVIEPTSFHPLKNLEFLGMSRNPHLVLPAEGMLRWASNLSSLDLSNSGLKALPHDILKYSPKLDTVRLDNNMLTSLKISVCGTIGNTDLHTNHIEHLTKDTFSFMCGGDKLYLTWNRMWFVEPSSMATLRVRSVVFGGYSMTLEVLKNISIGISGSKVEELVIMDAYLGHFPEDFFEPLLDYSLSGLVLSENHIVPYPSVFKGLKGVSDLDLSYNKLVTVEPDFFDGMHQLKVLNLNTNWIKYINTKARTWSVNLVEMHLSQNSLIKISNTTFRGLQNLVLLDLTENRALRILEVTSFFGLERLDTIKLSGSNILSFQLVIPSLKSLSLDNMAFPLVSMFPGSSFNHSKFLQHLEIRNSMLMYFNLWDPRINISLFDGLFNLTTLDLSRNPIYKYHAVNMLQPRIFRQLSALKMLSLEQCNLSSIHPLAFAGLESLRVLNLKGNIIQQLHPDLLKDLGQVRSIQIADNRLAYLDGDIFANNKVLNTLLLSNNKLTRLNQNTFKSVESISSIDLSENPIICDCDLRWLFLWLNRPIKLLNGNLTICSSASLKPVREKPLLDFDPSELCGIKIARVVLSSLAAVSLVGIIVLCHHYRWRLRHRFFLLKLAVLGHKELQDARDHTEYEFDLNVIFHDDEEEWVLEHLRLPLEERLPQFERNVFGDRDLIAGMHYLEAVDYAVSRSYKTIILLSRAAVRDRWFMLKFRTAMDHVTDTQTEFVLVIFLEDIPDEELPFLARLYLSDGRPYLHWPEDARGHAYFYDELTKHLTINLRTNDLIPN